MAKGVDTWFFQHLHDSNDRRSRVIARTTKVTRGAYVEVLNTEPRRPGEVFSHVTEEKFCAELGGAG